MCKRFAQVAALALMALYMSAANATAQITTGTVTGTVKDAQGGVVPGATVVLISEATRNARRRRPSPTRSGDYVFPNVTRRHLHRRSDDGRLQDAAADRRQGQRRRPRGSPGTDHRSRRRDRDRQRHGRSRARPVAERGALVCRHDRAGRESADRPRQLHQPDRARSLASVPAARPPAARASAAPARTTS